MDRTRQDGAISTATGNRRILRVGASSVDSTYGSVRTGSYRFMNDVVVPNFRRRVSDGEIFNNPMTYVSYIGSGVLSGYSHARSPNGLGTGESYSDSFDSLLHWKLGPLPIEETWPSYWTLISSSDQAEFRAEASARAIREYSSSDANGWVILGELEETLRLLRNPFVGITKLLNELYRLRGFKPTAVFRELSSQYLKIIFGILPLMSEVENVLKAFEDSNQLRTTFRGSKGETRNLVRQNLLLHAGSVLVDSRYTETIQHAYNVRAGILHAAEIPGLTRRLGLQFSALPKAAWELLTLSFVLDWVFNVKRYIESLTFSLVNSAKAEWIAIENVTTVTRVVTSTTVVSSGGWSVTKPCTDTDSMVYTTKTRYPVSLGAQRTITPMLPSSIGKYVSALAIVAQRFF